MAEFLCEQGATNDDLAEEFGVSITAIKRWQATYPEFRAALKVGKATADDQVERNLYQRAMGYSYDSEKVQVLASGTVVRVPIVVHVPPDVTAMIFWLKNRRPDLWRDVHKVEHEHKTVREMTDDELARIAAGGGDGDNPPPVSPPQLN